MAFPEEQAANAIGMTFLNDSDDAKREFYGITNTIGALQEAVEAHSSDLSPEKRIILLQMLSKVSEKLLES